MSLDTDTDFEAAFKDFSKDGPVPDTAAAPAGEESQDAATDAGADADTGDGAGAAADSGGADPGSAPAADPAEAAPVNEGGDTPVAGGSPEPEAKPVSEDANAVLERLARIVAEQKPDPAAEPKPEPAADEQPVYTADEQTVLDAYEKDWSEVARAEELRWRGRARDIATYVFSQIAQELRPVKELTEALADRAHFTDLRERVGEVDDNLRTNVTSWVEKQPAYLQTAYKQVLTTGSVDEVADLVERYRKETGTAKSAAPAPSKGGSELSGSAKQAAEALAPVSSKRSQIEQQDDPNDFGAAWGKFSEMFKD